MAAGKKKPEEKKPDTPQSESSLRNAAEEQLVHSPSISPNLAEQTPAKLIHELQVHQIELEMQAEELRKSHLALEESRDKFLDLYDFAPTGYLTLTDKALITEVNLTGATLLGVVRSKLIHTRFRKFIVQNDFESWDRYFAEVLNLGEKQTCTLTLIRADGSVFPARLESSRITGSDGTNPVRIAISDITDIWQIEALKESECSYRGLFNTIRQAIYILNPDGTFVDVNEGAEVMYGYAKKEFIGRTPEFLSAPGKNDLATVMEYIRKAFAGEPQMFEFWGLRKGGEQFPKDVCLSKGTYFGKDVVVAVGSDITERKKIEEALALTSRKLALLSSITRHDIINQLTVLVGYLTILQKKQSDPTLNDYFLKVSTAAQRISSMVQFTKEYETIGVDSPTWQDCRTLADTAAKQAPLGKVVVKNELPAGTEVYADPLVVKVFYNLMDNAVRYGGKITTIRFSFKEVGDDHLIVCEDDGDGIVVEEKEKIFERGFGKNTGFGLALSREILTITGITIRETGEPGKGAQFEMTVPKGAWK